MKNTNSNKQEITENTPLLNSICSEKKATIDLLNMPDEILIKTMLLLPPKYFSRFSRCCNKLYKLSQSDKLRHTLELEMKNIPPKGKPLQDQIDLFAMQLKKYKILKKNNYIIISSRVFFGGFGSIFAGIAFITIGLWALFGTKQTATDIGYGVFFLVTGILMLKLPLTALAISKYKQYQKSIFLNNKIKFFSDHLQTWKNEINPETNDSIVNYNQEKSGKEPQLSP